MTHRVALVGFFLLTFQAFGLDWGAICGRATVSPAPEDDKLRATLKHLPIDFRDNLFRQAKGANGNLWNVRILGVDAQLRWMKDRVGEVSASLGSGLRRIFPLDLTYERERFLGDFASRLEAGLSSAESVSYAEYLYLSSLFTRAMTLGDKTPEFEFGRFGFEKSPLVIGEFNLERAMMRPSRSIIDGESDLGELTDYVIIPINQPAIDEDLIHDHFLRLMSMRIYPMGLQTRARMAHGHQRRTGGFAEHDLLHAKQAHKAWKYMRRLSVDGGIDASLNAWYSNSFPHTDELIDKYIVEKNRIADPNLRKSVEGMAWKIFHEDRIPFNALDAYHLAHFSLLGRAFGFYGVGTEASFKEDYGRHADFWAALQWHRDYWKSQLHSDAYSRDRLLAAHEAMLLENEKIIPHGGVHYRRR